MWCTGNARLVRAFPLLLGMQKNGHLRVPFQGICQASKSTFMDDRDIPGTLAAPCIAESREPLV
jgi:hypothetical protein